MFHPASNALTRSNWQVVLAENQPDWLQPLVRSYLADDAKTDGRYAAALLWQRGIQDVESVRKFLDSSVYVAASPFDFGLETSQAVDRLQQAYENPQDKIAIWGDFDADGVTATAVLWQGLGQFFPQHERLVYSIPDRLTESHGLNAKGLERLAAEGCTVLVTCDTGSTNLDELAIAHQLGLDVIITDHHTLPAERPPVLAIINPRYLDPEHPLAHLSGVAVAYKLIEALYQQLPQGSEQPLEDLLDLVAIGLIADLVNLIGDCRYLAQRGIQVLQRLQQEPDRRPGIAKLLELCKKAGDRPTDISFGIGPRINAVSRVRGDAQSCVELLTSPSVEHCHQLAYETELLNTRRQELQATVLRQATAKLAQLDLSTTAVIVLWEVGWPVGVLGLVAAQIAQQYHRPTILLSVDEALELKAEDLSDGQASSRLARGSARSVNQIDLYQLVRSQSDLLDRFGGHPYAAGLSLPVSNLSLFTAGINRALREQGESLEQVLTADLVVTVAALGRDLFQELKLLEPYGMGNPVPRLLIQNCWFSNSQHQNLRDQTRRKIRHLVTRFTLHDESSEMGFPGMWWGHAKDDLPAGRCNVLVELDFNTFKKNYEVRLVDVRLGDRSPNSATPPSIATQPSSAQLIVDQRDHSGALTPVTGTNFLPLTDVPHDWAEWQFWLQQAQAQGCTLAIAYPPPEPDAPQQVWQQLVGIAKHLSRTQTSAAVDALCQKLNLSQVLLQQGLKALEWFGFESLVEGDRIHISQGPLAAERKEPEGKRAIAQFLLALQEDQFRQQYFYDVPLTIVETMATQGEKQSHE